MTQPTARFRNPRAWVLWIFALIWDAATALLGFIVLSEWAAAEEHWKGLLALGIFGAAALGLTVWALDSALTTVEVRPGQGLLITRRYPLWVRRQVLPAADVVGATVVDDGDSDGGSYYVCRVELRKQPPFDLLARGRRDRAEAEAARFNAAVGSSGRGPARRRS